MRDEWRPADVIVCIAVTEFGLVIGIDTAITLSNGGTISQHVYDWGAVVVGALIAYLGGSLPRARKRFGRDPDSES